MSYGSVETCAGSNPFRRDRAGVRAAIVATKRGNARGAKGGRKRNHMGQLDPFKKHNRLLNELKLCGQTSLGEAKALLWCVGTARAGEGNPASPQSLWSGVRRNSGNRGVGKFATGEPDAGDPQVRFGGGSETNQCLVPTSISSHPRGSAHRLLGRAASSPDPNFQHGQPSSTQHCPLVFLCASTTAEWKANPSRRAASFPQMP